MEEQINNLLKPIDSKIKDDFDVFLQKVNEVESMINELSSNDETIARHGLERADEYLNKESERVQVDAEETRTVQSRTVLNKNVCNSKLQSSTDNSFLSKDEFMKVFERDAEERYNRRIKKQS